MENVKSIYLDENRVKEILDQIFPDMENIFTELKYNLGGRLPADLSYGIVAGYLRGKGHSWESSFLGMEKFINIAKKFDAVEPPKMQEFKIEAKQDGSVTTFLK